MADAAIEPSFLKEFLLGRQPLSHKWDYGHCLLVCGSSRMGGAAIMATRAALHSGCGLVTLHSGRDVCSAAMASCPSAMFSQYDTEVLSEAPSDLSRYRSIGVGPGLGRDPRTVEALSRLLDAACEKGIPLVVDADALNIISMEPSLMEKLPKGSVLTPHDGELYRLRPFDDPSSKERAILHLVERTGCTLVSKGYRTRVYTPDGKVYVNTTGNPGMAKGGSGDVLTGLLSGLIARGYEGWRAACLAVWIHGYAADSLSERVGMEAFCASEIVDYLYEGFSALYK